LCREWQVVLRLQDWKISVNYIREKEMHMPGQAQIDWMLEDKVANIGIRDPLDWVHNSATNLTLEENLVHELIHLHLAPLQYDKPFEGLQKVAMENADQFMAEALVKLKHKGVDNFAEKENRNDRN
jgi:hypothetical protein